MSYSEGQMAALSRIAYLLNADNFKNINGDPPSVTELISQIKTDDGKTELDFIAEHFGVSKEDMESWKIVASVGSEYSASSTGMQAFVIETGTGEAVVAFRGSETECTAEEFMKDWGNGDLKLLNAKATSQHAAIDKMLSEKDGIGNMLKKYDSLAFTGHSLGGNLAEYATLQAARQNYTNVTQCVSLDGPGFSREFIAEYSAEIALMEGIMTHYCFSPVGALLFDLSERPGMYQDIHSDGLSFAGHSLTKLYIDKETGRFVREPRSLLTQIISKASKGIDDLPTPLCDAMVITVYSAMYIVMHAKEVLVDENGLTPPGIAAVASLATIICLFPAQVATFVITTVIALIAFVICAAVFELAIELIGKIAEKIAEIIADVLEWAKEKLSQIKKALVDLFDKIDKWFKERFDANYRFTLDNTFILFDRNVADEINTKLNRIKNRLQNNILVSLKNIVSAVPEMKNLKRAVNSLNSDPGKLNNCKNFLVNTADYFNTADNDVKKQLANI